MTIKSLTHLFLLMALITPTIVCDNNFQNSLISENSGRVGPSDDYTNDSILISKLIKEKICRKNLNMFVRELCRPYLRAGK